MTTINWTDPETGEPCSHDITGWQLVIDSENGEVMRADFVTLVLLTAMRTAMTPGEFRHSLLTPDGPSPIVEPSGWWLDLLVEKR